MFLSLLILAMVTAGGFGLTYLFTDDRRIMWRLAVGNIAGSIIFGILCFFAAKFVGLNLLSIGVCALIVLAGVVIPRSEEKRKVLRHDWDKAKGRAERFTAGRVLKLGYYLGFMIMFAAFFDRAMIVTANGIFTGASNNLGDLPFHLGAIYSFTEAGNFLPENTSFAGAKLTYPFLADFLAAVFIKLGMSVRGAMLLQNITWAFSLLIVLETFAARVTGSRLAGKIAPLILFFSGGLGYVWFLKDWWDGAAGIFTLLWNLPRDYTIGDHFRWGNSMVVLFITQRSILLGMPLAVFLIHHIWDLFSAEESEAKSETTVLPAFFCGLAAGTFPLVHAHSLFVLFVVCAVLFFFSVSKWKSWIAFASGTVVVAVPLLGWMLSGGASKTTEFIAWHFGFDSRGENLAWFWIKNTGILIPALLGGLAWLIYKRDEDESETVDLRPAIFALPFVLLFVVSNVVKFAPWEWDNIKVLIYAFVGLLPFAAYLVTVIWERGGWQRTVAAAILVVLVASGALDVWRTASSQMEYEVFSADAVEIAEQMRDRIAKDAVILNAPTYNSAAVLTGRPSLMRYIGHLSSHGIDYSEREADLKRIYAGDSTAEVLLSKYGIDFVLVTPQERKDVVVSEVLTDRLELFAASGNYRVYRVKKPNS